MKHHPLITALGVPELMTVDRLASILDTHPSALAPTQINRNATSRRLLGYVAEVLKGGDIDLAVRCDPELAARAFAAVEKIDEGAWTVTDLGARLKTWGMETAPEWVDRMAGIAEDAHGIGGWGLVRTQLREMCR